ncbi:hypothetical protein C8J57DRAFT_1608333, partial [Mycena rebaudengoi]
MPTAARISNLVQYITHAATAAQVISNACQVPFFAAIGTLSLEIAKYIGSVSSRKEVWLEILDQIHEILCTAVHLYSLSETERIAPPALLYDLSKLTEILEKIYTFLKVQQGMGKLRQLWKQSDTSAKLETCKTDLEQSLNTFRACARISTSNKITQLRNDAKKNHEELLALLEAHPELTKSDYSSSVSGLQSMFSNNSAGSLSILPAAPKIFHGRTWELQKIVDILKKDTARIAILGTGGMGKTSLATAVIHHDEVVTKYQQQYFVGCHSAATCNELVAGILSHIGLEKGPGMSRRIIHHFQLSPPSLLVLDNLETVWEPDSSRKEVEDFLSLLADVPHLAIVVTMRGAELPGKVKWSKPFLPPLKPLSDSAALQTFIEIADDDHEEQTMEELLALTDNLPLAVSLIANVAGAEGCETALSRWRTENTQLLSDGYDQRTSLNISIMVSLYSSRMTSEAQDLLSILSMLPDGLSQADLVHIPLPIPNVLACRVILLQTTLAYLGSDNRLKVLVPIREYVWHAFPPSDTLKSAVLQHFQSIVGVWKPNQESYSLVAQIKSNLGNINNILQDTLHAQPATASGVATTIIHLNHFCRHVTNSISPLFVELWKYIQDREDDPVFGLYLRERLFSSTKAPLAEPDTQIALGNQFFQNGPEQEQAKWYNALSNYYAVQGHISKGIECCNKLLALPVTANVLLNYEKFSALDQMSHFMVLVGDPLAGKSFSEKALRSAEALGDLHAQQAAMNHMAQCSLAVGNYKSAAELLIQVEDMLSICGLHGGSSYVGLQTNLAEIHYLKTEYTEAKKLLQALLSTRMGQVPTLDRVMVDINMALVYIAMNGDAEIICHYLNSARSISQTLSF